MQLHYDEGVGAARLAVILAGESPPAEESSHCCSHIQQRASPVESLEVKAPGDR